MGKFEIYKTEVAIFTRYLFFFISLIIQNIFIRTKKVKSMKSNKYKEICIQNIIIIIDLKYS